jgi:hypothetical protein
MAHQRAPWLSRVPGRCPVVARELHAMVSTLSVSTSLKCRPPQHPWMEGVDGIIEELISRIRTKLRRHSNESLVLHYCYHLRKVTN